MNARREIAALGAGLLVAAGLLGGCGGGGDGVTPSPTTTARPTPTGEPTTPAAEGGLLVVPQQLNGFSIAGQQVVFLVALAEGVDTGGGGPGPGGSGDAPGGSDQSDTRRASASDLPITVTAEASGGSAEVLEPVLEEVGDVAEVVVVPDAGSVGSTVAVTITGSGTDVTERSEVGFDVVEGEDDRAEYATELRDRFVPWLEANRPDLGISSETEWQGTMVSPQWLVVSHYLFFSEEWEMHVEWHIMVAPDDWARIDLRRRFVEVAPSRAFEIASVTEGTEPREIEPPETIWR